MSRREEESSIFRLGLELAWNSRHPMQGQDRSAEKQGLP